MKKRIERINKEMKEQRALKRFKKRVLNKGVRNVHTSTNKVRKKKSIKVGQEGTQGIGLNGGESREENKQDIIPKETLAGFGGRD